MAKRPEAERRSCARVERRHSDAAARRPSAIRAVTSKAADDALELDDDAIQVTVEVVPDFFRLNAAEG